MGWETIAFVFGRNGLVLLLAVGYTTVSSPLVSVAVQNAPHVYGRNATYAFLLIAIAGLLYLIGAWMFRLQAPMLVRVYKSRGEFVREMRRLRKSDPSAEDLLRYLADWDEELKKNPMSRFAVVSMCLLYVLVLCGALTFTGDIIVSYYFC